MYNRFSTEKQPETVEIFSQGFVFGQASEPIHFAVILTEVKARKQIDDTDDVDDGRYILKKLEIVCSG